jgi:hypothetical protein
MKNEKGQISLFFATTLFVLLSFLAFVINIGIFVKVKINLQNAVDASAFSGAAVQARQLTNISYLNWEMRNVYKEWMFKYYILGNLNINDVAEGPTGPGVKFNMRTYNGDNSQVKDRYNIPSICIDFAGQGVTALCKNYVIPGLPRFSPINVSGMDQTTNSIMDTLTNEKNKDCAMRSQINFLSATLWAYNVGSTNGEQNALQIIAPEIAADRSGAFPKAFELALRMRSLEMHVNTPPKGEGVCLGIGSANSDFCSQQISDLQNSATAGDERIIKAFFSGVRNLGGSEGDTNEELRQSFTLKEIPINPYNDQSVYSTSNLLIPEGNNEALNKHYLDLKLITLNLATFYTTFSSLKDEIDLDGFTDTVSVEASCAATKTGLPVPGYPLGYVKNPDVVTYYAVEGRAKFVGMFNPFQDDGTGIELAAYAAAKPFGGRIGPMLFNMKDSATITPRVSSGQGKKLSSAFLLGMNSTKFVDKAGNTLAPGEYSPGAPLPVDPPGSAAFWQSEQTASVGGRATGGTNIVFSVPNMIYDYPGNSPAAGGYFASDNIEVLDPSTDQEIVSGLYNADIFNKFRAKINGLGGNISTDAINAALLKVRAPTKWEANNYLIPTPEGLNSAQKVDSFGFVPQGNLKTESSADGHVVYNMSIFAPLFGENAILKNSNDVKGVLDNYLANQEGAIKKYLKSMNSAAASTYKMNPSGGTGTNLGTDSANLISDIPEEYMNGTNDSQAPEAIPSCNSIAGKFIWFYYGASKLNSLLRGPVSLCHPPNIQASDSHLSGMLQKYFSSGLDQNFHQTQLVITESDMGSNNLFTAYRPGAQTDGSPSGVWRNTIRSGKNMQRNFYSTKFVPLKSTLSNSNYSYSESGGSAQFPIHSEGNKRKLPSGRETTQGNFINTLNPSAISLDLSDINH